MKINILVALVAFCFGGLIGSELEHRSWKKEMISKHLAEYNSRSGEWQWVDNVTISVSNNSWTKK
jgi:hypothetical protein